MKSTNMWEVALNLALECVDNLKLTEQVTSVQEREQRSMEALALLTKRYVSVNRLAIWRYYSQCAITKVYVLNNLVQLESLDMHCIRGLDVFLDVETYCLNRNPAVDRK
jgi:hypothetical protein